PARRTTHTVAAGIPCGATRIATARVSGKATLSATNALSGRATTCPRSWSALVVIFDAVLILTAALANPAERWTALSARQMTAALTYQRVRDATDCSDAGARRTPNGCSHASHANGIILRACYQAVVAKPLVLMIQIRRDH